MSHDHSKMSRTEKKKAGIRFDGSFVDPVKNWPLGHQQARQQVIKLIQTRLPHIKMDIYSNGCVAMPPPLFMPGKQKTAIDGTYSLPFKNDKDKWMCTVWFKGNNNNNNNSNNSQNRPNLEERNMRAMTVFRWENVGAVKKWNNLVKTGQCEDFGQWHEFVAHCLKYSHWHHIRLPAQGSFWAYLKRSLLDRKNCVIMIDKYHYDANSDYFEVLEEAPDHVKVQVWNYDILVSQMNMLQVKTLDPDVYASSILCFIEGYDGTVALTELARIPMDVQFTGDGHKQAAYAAYANSQAVAELFRKSELNRNAILAKFAKKIAGMQSRTQEEATKTGRLDVLGDGPMRLTELFDQKAKDYDFEFDKNCSGSVVSILGLIHDWTQFVTAELAQHAGMDQKNDPNTNLKELSVFEGDEIVGRKQTIRGPTWINMDIHINRGCIIFTYNVTQKEIVR